MREISFLLPNMFLFYHAQTISNNCSEILCYIIGKCFLVILFILSGFSFSCN